MLIRAQCPSLLYPGRRAAVSRADRFTYVTYICLRVLAPLK